MLNYFFGERAQKMTQEKAKRMQETFNFTHHYTFKPKEEVSKPRNE